MIFIIDNVDNVKTVWVYQDIPELARYIEWQDIFEGKDIITDQEGNIYKWDKSKQSEYGTIYNYTLIQTGEKFKFIAALNEAFKESGNQDEFVWEA